MLLEVARVSEVGASPLAAWSFIRDVPRLSAWRRLHGAGGRRFQDMPAQVTSLLVENRDGIGPYGAKGIGDGPTSVMCAAIGEAIYEAVGVRLHEAPFTPERVWRAIQAKKQANGGAS